MDIQQSVKTVLASYAKFEGRSGRAEYWWWVLAYMIAYVVIYAVGSAVGMGQTLVAVFGLALLVPNVAVSIRRFHDIGKSGWWCLIFLIPIVNIVAWIYFFIKVSEGPNQYGEGPQAAAS